jgi:hypothetical protein
MTDVKDEMRDEPGAGNRRPDFYPREGSKGAPDRGVGEKRKRVRLLHGLGSTQHS